MCKKDFLRYAELRLAEKKRNDKKEYLKSSYGEYYPSVAAQKCSKIKMYKNARY